MKDFHALKKLDVNNFIMALLLMSALACWPGIAEIE